MRSTSFFLILILGACGGDKDHTASDSHDTQGSTQGTTHATTHETTHGTGTTAGTDGGTGTTTTTTHATTTHDHGTTHGSTTHDDTTHGTTHDHATTHGGSTGVHGATEWYMTCGDPVCGGHTDMGLPECTDQKEGAPCDTPGAHCDPVNDCNAIFVCAEEDPKADECPKSRARFKRDIDYLGPEELRRLHDDLREIRLATYRYRDAGASTKLGLILEDGPAGPWIDDARDRVDLYAYTSLAIAALQVQADELAALRRELDALRAGRCAP